jgi:hypothetical protein
LSAFLISDLFSLSYYSKVVLAGYSEQVKGDLDNMHRMIGKVYMSKKVC